MEYFILVIHSACRYLAITPFSWVKKDPVLLPALLSNPDIAKILPRRQELPLKPSAILLLNHKRKHNHYDVLLRAVESKDMYVAKYACMHGNKAATTMYNTFSHETRKAMTSMVHVYSSHARLLPVYNQLLQRLLKRGKPTNRT